ncbi:hypothetical protein F5X68DRAFT_66828 [Plectosphaerella plurivora]|uniref:CAP-Gly domain-containing protein n=1 Tax=Plectosphaerella plurivora TaxID=936078 RepID=A0A9P9AAW5_9PEZI|nr:hypothetical protein F5X68DRAFT_66828 [Plectosphaerella plurivora]
MSSTLTETTSTNLSPSRPRPPRSLRKASSITNISSKYTASSPSLNTLYSAQGQSRLAPPATSSGLARKGSLATLTLSSLASIPDASETYLNSVLSDDPDRKMTPTTPGRGGGGGGGDDFVVGDVVDVPGGMYGTVRFVGNVDGKKGTFAGIELHRDFAARGKNSGDVDGVSYFSTNIPGAGIFVPTFKASRKDGSGGPGSAGSIPFTPSSSTLGGLRRIPSINPTSPTPTMPRFSQSVGPGARAPSPQMKLPRPSLPRPESPVRRLMTPGPRPSIAATPASKVPARYGSPTPHRFAQSVRGTAGDPNKRVPKLDRKPSVGPRSASALGQNSQTSGFTDDESTPQGLPRAQTNGSVSSVTSFSSKFRPPSRTASRANNSHNDEEVERLRSQLENREKQLREQSSALIEMEKSLTELQGLMDNADFKPRRDSMDDKDAAQLRAILREKNEKIAMLTAEFDDHRADFRSTIDTLEMASTETERVYEERIKELQQEILDHQSRTDDVDSVAHQLKQLEILVQELEEGLEDARRGEAEARGEVEFLRGEVERTRSELKREREKSSKGGSPNGSNGANGDMVSVKELASKEDEIRGLKAIIHSLSRDSIPTGDDGANSGSAEAGASRERMEREMTDLRAMLDDKSHREEELQREIDTLRRSSLPPNGNGIHRSSYRDSRDTVILAGKRDSRSPEAVKRVQALASMAESDTYSSVTDTTELSTLWCEICETNGHDVLTCTQMFGDLANRSHHASNSKSSNDLRIYPRGHEHEGVKPAPLSTTKDKTPLATPTGPVMPNPLDSGPVAGKASGVVDASKWCALCERDGHDSVDCPFEDAF